MSTASAPMTIEGVELAALGFYVREFDTANELELITRLRKLPWKDFVLGMQALTDYLNLQHQGTVIDRYLTLLIEKAGGEPEDQGMDS